ncbi:MAG: hypothetical protein ACPG4T_06355 [Nannocystaceae bacterium]
MARAKRLGSLFAIFSQILAISSCDEPGLTELAYSGENLDYYTDSSDLCAGTPIYMDTQLSILRNLFGTSGKKIRYYWLTTVESLVEYCGKEVKGCWIRKHQSATTFRSTHVHELVHAASTEGYRAPKYFREGTAEIFDFIHTGEPETVDDIDGDLLFETPTPRSIFQGAALISSLAERTSLLTVVEFLRDSPTDEELDEVFEEHFGESIDQAIEAYLSRPRCNRISQRLAIQECRLPATPSIDKTWAFEDEFNCAEDQHVLGPQDNSIWTYRTIELDADNLAEVTMQGQLDHAYLQIVRCSPCSRGISQRIVPSSGEKSRGSLSETVFLSAGKYYIEFHQELGGAPYETQLELVY